MVVGIEASAEERACRLPTREELIEEDKTFELFYRRRHFDILGCFLFAAFIVVAIAYAFFRIQYSIAPLRGLIWYGILVFFIEMIGAVSIMFYGIWLIAAPDNSDIVGLEMTPAPAPALPYPRARAHVQRAAGDRAAHGVGGAARDRAGGVRGDDLPVRRRQAAGEAPLLRLPQRQLRPAGASSL